MHSNQNILFVDSDHRLLKGFQRVFGIETGYGLFFADHDARAFDIVENNKIDFVVSGTKVGNMTGNKFLENIKRLNPATVRLLLSGYDFSDINCSCSENDCIHCYIEQPCDSLSLVKVISKISHRWASVSKDKRVMALKAETPRWLPETVEYLNNCRDLDIRDLKLLDILSADLGFICWAIYQSRRQIARMEFSGLTDMVKKLIISGVLFGNGALLKQAAKVYEDEALLQYQRRIFSHSLLTAKLAVDIVGERLGDSSVYFSQALLAGLLHDVGKLMLVDQHIQQVQVTPDILTLIDTPAKEVKYYGIDHSSMGSMVFGLWGLPEAVLEAVAEHHDYDGDNGNIVKEILIEADQQANALVGIECV